jgi:hypothetical protein
MSEQGLRAWIGEVERKLRARTRVMLALAVIAIGAAGAAVYLAVEAHDTAVSEGDVQALQQRLEARIDQVGGTVGGGTVGGGAATAKLEAEIKALKAQVEALKGGTAKEGSAKEEPGTKGPTTKGQTTEGSAKEGPTRKAHPPSSGLSGK